MEMSNIPFGTTDWSAVAPTRHPGETGTATWRTQTFNGIRVRIVEYSTHSSRRSVSMSLRTVRGWRKVEE